MKVKDILFEFKEGLRTDATAEVLTLTEKNGFVRQSERFNKRLATKDLSKYKLIRRDDFAFNPYLLWAGAIARNSKFEEGVISPLYPTFKARPGYDPAYIQYLLLSSQMLSQYDSIAFGSVPRRRRSSVKDFLDLPIPVIPPLTEQQRIAEILDISQRQFELLDARKIHLDALRIGLVEKILTVDDRKTVPLKEIAEIQSGITKGRKVRNDEVLSETAYMAVSNVKDGHLNLETVKTLPVTDKEITRFRLLAGDILLTEGGDPDKLGRGTVWRGEIETCLHQNHIFRVRLAENSRYTPEVLMSMLATKQSRAYFLRSAKQTTGIASINKTQLSAVPVPILTDLEISKLTEILTQIELLTDKIEKNRTAAESLHRSLSARAFTGQL